MSAEQNKAFIQRYINAISGKPKPAELLQEYIGESDVLLMQHIAGTEASFPNYELIVEDMIAEGDKVVVRARLLAIHKGKLMDIPATGAHIDVAGIMIYRIVDGKIGEHWICSDMMGLMEQINAVLQHAVS